MYLSGLTWGDIFGCLRSVVAFAAVLLAPGYCVAWACNLLGFRQREAGERLAWAVTLSFGVATILSILVGKFVSFSAVCWLAVLCAVGFAAILTHEAWSKRGLLRIDKRYRIGAGIAVAWILFILANLLDIGIGNRLYFSVTVVDHSLRTAFVNAVLRTGVPPTNPLNWPGHAVPMRYYYFWYVVTATAARLSAATARQAIIASAAWSGIGLAAIISLYCKNFLGKATGTRRWPRVSIALALLTVTGLDIIPALVKVAAGMPPDGDMEWWSLDQVTSWMDSLLWVPHHVAGLVCCLLGFLLVWMSKGLRLRQKIGCGAIAGLAFASAFGLSTWVAVAFAMIMAAWILWVLLWEKTSRQRVATLLIAGVVATIILLPYLAELRTEQSGSIVTGAPGEIEVNTQVSGGSVAQSASHLLRFGIRQVIPAESMLVYSWVARLARSYPVAETIGARLFLLIPGYLLELGFYLLVLRAALRAMRRRRLDEAGRTAVMLAGAALFVTTFFRSTVIDNNDFGYRSAMILQFFLLLLAVLWWEGEFYDESEAIEAKKSLQHKVMIAMAVIGVLGTTYQIIILRLYMTPNTVMAERSMALRRGFDEMDKHIAKDAVVQYNTARLATPIMFAQVMQVNRQTVDGQPGCGTAFGGDVPECARIEAGVRRLFSTTNSPDPSDDEESLSVPAGKSISAEEARSTCKSLGVDYLVATRWDGVWTDRQGWAWTLPKVVDTNEVRVIDCNAAMR